MHHPTYPLPCRATSEFAAAAISDATSPAIPPPPSPHTFNPSSTLNAARLPYTSLSSSYRDVSVIKLPVHQAARLADMPQVISNPSECVPSHQLLHIKILCLLGSPCILLPTMFPLHSPSWRDRCGLEDTCASSRDGACGAWKGALYSRIDFKLLTDLSVSSYRRIHRAVSGISILCTTPSEPTWLLPLGG
ncbi:hypothetical protein B0H11DRAFT_2189243 [Mycena galericulata]|nr:hypothetical protein B0H11DRAFT_2189243 [Mycena galericulata]